MDTPASSLYAGWLKARSDLLRVSVETTYALLQDARVDDEGWRTEVAAQTFLWRAVRDAEAPDVPPLFAAVDERGGTMLDLLADAGDALRTAIEQRDPELLTRAMGRLDAAEQAARSVFAAAYRVMDSGGER